MPYRTAAALLLTALIFSAGEGRAQTTCDSLSEPDRARADELLASTYIHDCCDETLDACLQQVPPCRLAIRMADNICNRVAAGQDDEQIQLALTLRARTMLPGYEPATFELDGVPRVGDPDAPVTVVEFADARGHHCARLTPPMVEAVTDGPLAGKVQLYLKVFPLRSNPHAKEAGLAFLAACELGGFWDFVLHAYAHFDDFTVEDQPAWAAAMGLDPERFEALVADAELTQRLVASKKEGLEHGVKSTPSFFIDGRLYIGELEVEELVDVLEEVADRAAGLDR